MARLFEARGMRAHARVGMVTAILLWSAAAPGASAPEAPAGVEPAPPTVRIWPGASGGSEPVEQFSPATSWHPSFIRNVREATLKVFLPSAAPPRGAVIVCPGGGFYFLTDEEGEPVARWLNEQGYAAAVLRYRLKPTPKSDLLFFLRILIDIPPLLRGKNFQELKPYAANATADAVQALRYVRSHRAQWRVSLQRVGMIGFSAGGMVALGASLAADARDRPDYTAAIYSGPLEIGTVPASAPPLYAAASLGDPLTPRATQPIAAAWAKSGAPVELKLYEGGGHGFSMQPKGEASDRWLGDLAAWLDRTAGHPR